jgi:hypothetical protein
VFVIDDIVNAIAAARAADQQQKQAQNAQGLQRDVYNQSRSDQMPWMQAGQSTLADLLGQMRGGGFDTKMDPSQIANDPGFQFRMQEGQKALERSAAARGGLNSGGFMKGMARYSQGLASDEYGKAWERNQMDNQNRFGRMYQMAGMGQNSAQNLGALGGQYANSMSDLYGAIGNAQAAGTMGVANGISGGIRSAGNLAMLGFGNPAGFAAGMGGGPQGGQPGGAAGSLVSGGGFRAPTQAQPSAPLGDYGYNPYKGYA